MIKLIAAISLNGVIGQNNYLPWAINEDLKFFKKMTMGGAVIMGRKTWESMGYRPLKGRKNIVVGGTKPTMKNEGDCLWATNPDMAVTLAKADGYKDNIWVIGGASIYFSFLSNNLIDECYITHIDQLVTGENLIHFPAFNYSNWDAERIKWVYYDRLIDDSHCGTIVKYTKKK